MTFASARTAAIAFILDVRSLHCISFPDGTGERGEETVSPSFLPSFSLSHVTPSIPTVGKGRAASGREGEKSECIINQLEEGDESGQKTNRSSRAVLAARDHFEFEFCLERVSFRTDADGRGRWW